MIDFWVPSSVGGFMCCNHLSNNMRRIIVVLILLFAAIPTGLVTADSGEWSTNTDDYKGVSISEILVSPNGEDYGGVDWNGDGEISTDSDQYIQLTNDGTVDIDLSDWTLDDIAMGGSASCQIQSLTIAAGESITFYRADTSIALDFFDGDSALLIDSSGTTQSTFTYPANDSDWGRVYTAGANGMLQKADPNPASTQGTCTVGETDNSGGGNSGGDNSASVGEWSVNQDNYLDVKISEILVSSSGEDYDGVDLDGDGEVWTNSEQYIQLTNDGNSDVDISDWVLDDNLAGGSAPCSIGWNTTISPGESITFYRSKTRIELDYFEADFAVLKDTSGTIQSSIEYPANEPYMWDIAYTLNEDGTLGKNDANPADRQGTCYIQAGNSESKYILKGRIVPMTGENDAIENGNIMIDEGMIIAIWADGQLPPINTDGITVHDTEASIYPGLIDLHNHMHYNHIPLWDFNVHLSDSQQSDEGGYTNRYQWGNNWDYGPSITWMKTNIQSYNRWDMSSEQMKYAEVQAVAGGVTAVQGSPSSGTDSWDSMLSRNVELYNFGQDGMYTCAVCGPTESDYNANYIIEKNQSGSLNAWFVHLSEGVDSSSKSEFDILYNKGLIMDETVVIHGTALDQSQFDKMGEVGAGLVWSPVSNLLLYGDTTDVVAADNAGVTISLAPDWGPSGSKNNLHELKVADMWNRESLDGHFSDYELAEMVTSNAAEISNWQGFVGQIKVGMYADLVVVNTFHDNPYRNLIEAIDPDIKLTVVHGKAVFGDVDIMTAMNGDDWEYINGSGFTKAVDVTSPSETDGMQTWEDIESGLSMAMLNDFDDIKANWNEVSDMSDSQLEDWLATTFDGDYKDNVNHLKSLTLDPIFTMNDERYFDVINRSTHANYHIDMSKLYDYYDIAYDANGNRPYIEDSEYTNNSNVEPEPRLGCMDPTAQNYNTQANQDNGSCTYEGDNTGDGGDNVDNTGDGGDNVDNTGGDDNSDSGTCTGICDEGVSNSAESDSTDPIILLSIVMVVILIASVAVIVLSRERDDPIVHKEHESQFVPELPPIKPPEDSN
jgi:5-methylthioadenosine/S-adenosylhomocysteine deaminase